EQPRRLGPRSASLLQRLDHPPLLRLLQLFQQRGRRLPIPQLELFHPHLPPLSRQDHRPPAHRPPPPHIPRPRVTLPPPPPPRPLLPAPPRRTPPVSRYRSSRDCSSADISAISSRNAVPRSHTSSSPAWSRVAPVNEPAT